MPARTLALGFALFLLASLPAADPPPELRPAPHPKGYVCHRPTRPIVIDGKHDQAWDDAPWSEEFVDISTDVKPRHRTRMKMLHDDAALYIFAELDDPHVWGTLKDHDSVIYHDNDFEVFLDPDGDNHMYGELELNALNTTWDLLLTKPYRDGGSAVNAWEIKGLQTAVQVNGTLNDPTDTDRGWTVEIRWPYTSVAELSKANIPPKDGEQWRINFSRVQWRHAVKDGKYVKDSKVEDNWVWSPQGAIDMHRPERWGYLQFSTAKPGKARFEPDADWPTKDLLHRVYYAEHHHFKEHKRFSPDMEKLNLGGVAVPLSGAVQLETTKKMFEASLARPADASGQPRRFSINQDGRLKQE
ncbi:MAG: carbohydrate-binding family 9-like protein [Gemmataceae bacterium]